MAAPSVTADVSRVAVATIATDSGTWGNDGGGGGVADEPDIVYQGSTAQSRKVGSTVIGRSYTHGSGTDMDGTPTNRAHWIAKINATNYAALLTRTSPALHVKVGSGSSAYYRYDLFGSDNYPPLGGWQIIAIAPSVTGYRDATQGSPTLNSVLYWSVLGDFSTTSKAENVVIDAIDVGLGLFLVGGDGASTDAVWDDFVSYDEGTSGNRYGFVTTNEGVVFAIGQLAIGQTSAGTSTHTDFTDSGKTIVWRNGLVTTGFNRLLIDLATSGSVIDMSNCSFGSQGQIDNDGDRAHTTTEDSRPVFEVTGSNAGASLTMAGSVFDNWADFTLNSRCTLSNTVWTNCGQIDCGTGATIAGSTLSGYTGDADTSNILWTPNLDPAGELDNLAITKGTNAHHAVEFGISSPTTLNIDGMVTSGFNASDAQNDSTFYVKRTTGTVTINVTNGTGNFSYKSDGADVSVVIDPVTTEVNVVDENDADLQNARVYLRAADGTGDLPYEDSVTIARSGTTATVTHTSHGLVTGNLVKISGITDKTEDNSGTHSITFINTNSYSYTTTDSGSTSYTGTITSTGVIFNSLTDVNGQVTDSRTFSVDQPVTGRIAISSASPRYKPAPITGVIDSANGVIINTKMVRDD